MYKLSVIPKMLSKLVFTVCKRIYETHRMLRQIVSKESASNMYRVLMSIRLVSTASRPLVDLAVDDEGIAVLTMQRPPVNAINFEMLEEINKSLDEVNRSNVKALIFSSALSSVFSAGLDIRELYKPDIKKAENFFLKQQEVWMKLFGSSFITAAALNGHALGAGCLISLSCEYRAMVNGKFTIGLNETTLGIAPSPMVIDTIKHTISSRQVELALTSGRIFTVDEALQVGLIDDTASDKGNAIEKCKQFIRKFDEIPPFLRALTKQAIREAPLRRLRENWQKDLDNAIEFVVKDANTQKEIGRYLQKMQRGKTD